MTFRWIKLLLISMVTASPLIGGEPGVGDQAPDFVLPYATTDTINFDGITLSSFQGKKPVVLAFYPADFSPGCTTELCTIRDNFQVFNDIDTEVLAISGDYLYAHQAWIHDEGFQFKLLSDHQHKVAQMYASYRPKKGMNKRTVYVIDTDGKIAYKNLNYTAGSPEDFQALKDALKALEASSD